MGKGRNCSSGAISLLIHNILLPDVRFLCLNKDQTFSSRLAVIRGNRSRDNESRLYSKSSGIRVAYFYRHLAVMKVFLTNSIAKLTIAGFPAESSLPNVRRKYMLRAKHLRKSRTRAGRSGDSIILK